jgi:hypothetical protein
MENTTDLNIPRDLTPDELEDFAEDYATIILAPVCSRKEAKERIADPRTRKIVVEWNFEKETFEARNYRPGDSAAKYRRKIKETFAKNVDKEE